MNPYPKGLLRLAIIFMTTVMFFPEIGGIKTSVFAGENRLVIIASPDVFESTLSVKDIRDIFLGKKRKWTDGKEIVLAVMYQSDIHEEFTTKYAKKTPAQFLTYWKHMVFVGQGRFPKAFNSEEEMIDYIQRSHGAIGYLSKKPPEGKNIRIITLSE